PQLRCDSLAGLSLFDKLRAPKILRCSLSAEGPKIQFGGPSDLISVESSSCDCGVRVLTL
ncbi:hypothetical protein Nmel_010049, partial [Mimus melanotis]